MAIISNCCKSNILRICLLTRIPYWNQTQQNRL